MNCEQIAIALHRDGLSINATPGIAVRSGPDVWQGQCGEYVIQVLRLVSPPGAIPPAVRDDDFISRLWNSSGDAPDR